MEYVLIYYLIGTPYLILACNMYHSILNKKEHSARECRFIKSMNNPERSIFVRIYDLLMFPVAWPIITFIFVIICVIDFLKNRTMSYEE